MLISLLGFNNFVGLDIKEFGIQEADADGYNVYGKAIVDNPSPATVSLVCLHPISPPSDWRS